jgi:phosphohistidine swiveling domain-containing protein
VRAPLSIYAVPQTVNGSAVLYAVAWLGRRLGALGDAAAVVAATVGVMSGAAVLASRRPRLGTPIVLGLALLASGAVSAGAVALVVDTTRSERRAFLPSDLSWVDHAGIGRAILLQSKGGSAGLSLQELFWNRSVDRIMLLPGAFPVDGFRAPHVRVGSDGSLFADRRPIRSPLLIDEYGSTIRLRDARLLKTAPTAALWVPTGRARLSLYFTGRYFDGWLSGRGTIRLWPATGRRLAGWLSMRLTAPRESVVKGDTITFTLPGGRTALVRVTPAVVQRVKVAVCAKRGWQATYRSTPHRLVNRRPASLRSSVPLFTPDPSACSTSGLAP